MMTDTKIERKTETRVVWVDVAKGIGTFLIVLGHLLYVCKPSEINQAIYSFHIPMFFFLSGFMIKRKKDEKFFTFAKKKFLRLIVPAVFYMVVMLPIFFVYQNPHSTTKTLKLIFYYEGKLAFNDPCWFFIVLFEMLILERILHVKEQSTTTKTLVATFFLLMGFLIYQNSIFLPFGIDRAFVCFVFILAGEIVKDIIDKLKKYRNIKWWNVLSIMVVSGAIWVIIAVFINPKISIYSMKLRNYWFFVLAAGFGTMCYCCLCYLIAKPLKFLGVVGKNNLFVSGTHYAPVFFFKRFAKMKHFAYTYRCTIYSVLLAIAILSVSIPIDILVRKYFPWPVGERKRKNSAKKTE